MAAILRIGHPGIGLKCPAVGPDEVLEVIESGLAGVFFLESDCDYFVRIFQRHSRWHEDGVQADLLGGLLIPDPTLRDGKRQSVLALLSLLVAGPHDNVVFLRR